MSDMNRLFPFPEEKVRIENATDGIHLTLGDRTVTLSPDEAKGVAVHLIEVSVCADGMNPDELDSMRIPMQFLTYEVKNDSDAGSTGCRGSAIVYCWVSEQTRANACYVASGWIEQDGWTIVALLCQQTVTREDYLEKDELRYYEQALIDGEVFLFAIDDGNDEEQVH